MTTVSGMLAGLSANGGPVAPHVFPFVAVMLAAILVVGYVRRRTNGPGDDDPT